MKMPSLHLLSLFSPVTPFAAGRRGRRPRAAPSPRPIPLRAPGAFLELLEPPRVAVPCTHAEDGRRSATAMPCSDGRPRLASSLAQDRLDLFRELRDVPHLLSFLPELQRQVPRAPSPVNSRRRHH